MVRHLSGNATYQELKLGAPTTCERFIISHRAAKISNPTANFQAPEMRDS
jgi:hypothetical protein